MKTYILLAGEMDTARHDHQTLNTLISRYLYGLSATIQGDASLDPAQPWFRVSWISLDEDLETAYDLASEIERNGISILEMNSEYVKI